MGVAQLSSHRNGERCAIENQISIFYTVNILPEILYSVDTHSPKSSYELRPLLATHYLLNIEINFTLLIFFSM